MEREGLLRLQQAREEMIRGIRGYGLQIAAKSDMVTFDERNPVFLGTHTDSDSGLAVLDKVVVDVSLMAAFGVWVNSPDCSPEWERYFDKRTFWIVGFVRLKGKFTGGGRIAVNTVESMFCVLASGNFDINIETHGGSGQQALPKVLLFPTECLVKA